MSVPAEMIAAIVNRTAEISGPEKDPTVHVLNEVRQFSTDFERDIQRVQRRLIPDHDRVSVNGQS